MNLPDDPWALLELDRTVAGEREVKRAYARLLKQYRPETDPQGFRRVHDAYQTALEELSRGPHPDADPVEAGALGQEEAGRLAPEPEAPSTVAEPDPALVPRREVEPPILASFDGISENLLKRLGLVASSGDLPELTRLRNLVRQHPELAERWVEVLLKLVEGPAVQQVVSGMHAEDVWLLMREGQGQFAAGVMMQWRGTPAWLGRFNQLGNLLLEQSAGDHPDRLQAMHFTARMAAFYLPEVSGRLADELYRQGGPGVREQMVREIEIRSSAGRLFAQSGLPLKRFWEHQLFEEDSEATIDWNEPQRQAALREVVSTYPADWEGWEVVTQVVPEPVLRPLLAQRTRREPLPVYDTELEPDRPWFGGNGRWTWILVLVAIKAALFSMSSFKSIPEPPSRSGPPPLPSYPELRDRDNSPAATAQRRLDELRRKQDGDAKLPSGPSDPFPGLGPMMQDRRPVPRAEGDTADKRFRLD